MNVSKPYRETAAEEVDPIEVIKSARAARTKQIEKRGGRMLQVVALGMVVMLMLKFVDAPNRPAKQIYDISFIQRMNYFWLCLLFPSIAISILVKFRVQYAHIFSAKARTPSILIGLIGLSILIFAAVGFFSRPYTGARLNWTPEAGYFLGGWFLIGWGFVFGK